MSEEPQRTKASTARTRGPSGSGVNSRWIVGGVLLVLALIFILENREPVGIRLLIPLVVMPQWAALTLTLIVGFAVGVLVARRRR